MIKFTYGMVGSGKSLNLLSSYLTELRKHNPSEVALVKPQVDTRTAGVFTRFGNQEIQPTLIFSEENRLHWLLALEKKKIFFIDEFQFFPKSALDDILRHRKAHQEFYIYGLRNDFLGNMWEPIKELMNVADEIAEIETHCEICKTKKASFNKKTSGCKINNEVGFNYIPVCWKCFKTQQL